MPDTEGARRSRGSELESSVESFIVGGIKDENYLDT
jgi:hypothetical protein